MGGMWMWMEKVYTSDDNSNVKSFKSSVLSEINLLKRSLAYIQHKKFTT